MTWPLSKAAVEAAARAMYEVDRVGWERALEWQVGTNEGRAWWRDRATLCLRAALAAWEPSDTQINEASRRSRTSEIILAAVRTEAAE